MRRRGEAMLAGVLLLALAACGQRSAPLAPTTRASQESVFADRWEPMAPGPLSPRYDVRAFTLGEEILVVGGREGAPCPPTAGCAYQDEKLLRDGAAYRPATGAWRRIADAPLDLVVHSGVVIGGTLFVATVGGFAAYDAAADTWRRLPSPPRHNGGRLVELDGRPALIAASQERQEGHVPSPDWVYDAQAQHWEALPADPLAPSFDRDAVWTGKRLLLMGKAAVPNPGSDGPSLVRVAAYDPATRRWERLPDTGMIGGGDDYPWHWAGGKAVRVDRGAADGGQVGNYGRPYPMGGLLSEDGQWSPLPDPPSAVRALSRISAGGPEVVVGDGVALHVRSGRWDRLPADNRLPHEGMAAAWLGDHLYVWGGVRWTGDPSRRHTTGHRLLADGWRWSPPDR